MLQVAVEEVAVHHTHLARDCCEGAGHIPRQPVVAQANQLHARADIFCEASLETVVG